MTKLLFCIQRIVLLILITITAGLPSLSAYAAEHAVVLMYHRFGEPDYPSTNIQLEQFDAHLELLASGDYNVMPLADIINQLQDGQSLPDKTVAITIDDAYLSVYAEAWPRLRAYGFPATIFVATQPVDRNHRGYMNWDQLREMQADEFGIGSQTRTHPHMHMITPKEVEEELQISNDRFIAELGIRPNLFAYPYGEYNLMVIEAVKEAGFIAAFGQNSGIMNGYDGYYELPRFAMNEQYGSIDRLTLAINGLPLKVTHVTPNDVVLKENPPIYGFTMSSDMDAPKQLRCFNSIFGKLDVTTLGQRAEIRLPGPLTGKRARINCTMPGPDGRWRWYGRQFLLPDDQ